MLVCHILSLWINCQYATINHSGQPSTGTCNIIIGICRPQVSHLKSVHVVCLDQCQLIYQVYMCPYVGYPSLCHVSRTCIMPSTIHLCTCKITIGISLMSQSTTVIYLVVYAGCSDKLWLMPLCSIVTLSYNAYSGLGWVMDAQISFPLWRQTYAHMHATACQGIIYLLSHLHVRMSW